MQRFVSWCVLTVFVLWLLPLGVFVAPSKQKQFCDGQRAVCLCSHVSGPKKKAEPVKTIAKGHAEPQKESSGFSSHHYDAQAVMPMTGGARVSSWFSLSNFYSLLLCDPREHVPKA